MSDLKVKLHQQCLAYVQSRMRASTEAIDAAQQAQTEDTKSSAGDKYETGRAMMQQEKDRNSTQLNEANKLMVALNRISTVGKTPTAEMGSLVITDHARFYIAISAGSITVDGQAYYAVSPASPIGLKMNGLKAGESFVLNGKKYKVDAVL